MIKLLLLFGLGFFAVFRCESNTGQPYWPRNHKSWITYQNYVMGGSWNEALKQLPVVWKYIQPGRPVRTVQYLDESQNAYGSTLVRISNWYWGNWTDIGESVPDVTNDVVSGVLNDSVSGKPGINFYIGDIGVPSKSVLVIPGEPILPYYIQGGEHYEIAHYVMSSMIPAQGSLSYVFRTSFWTIGHYDIWGSFRDCWRTTLVEHKLDNSIQTVYQYVFARGIGLVDFWYGWPVNNRGDIQGFELYAIDWGQL